MFNYKLSEGMIGWLFHRISGLALIFYLCMHIWVVHFISVSPETFNKLMEILAQPLFKLGEVALLAAVLYHSLNGIRLILVEYVWGNANQKALFWATFLSSMVLTLVGAWFLLKDVVNV